MESPPEVVSTPDKEVPAVDEFIALNDRIDIFRHLAADNVDGAVNQQIFSGLLTDFYDEFVEFCNEVKTSSKPIHEVSCHIADGHIYFEKH